jgi:serine/threonine protein kinase
MSAYDSDTFKNSIKSVSKIDILGKGTYGCVIPKPLKCNKNINDMLSKPSKLFVEKQDFLDELKNMKFIYKHDKGRTCISFYDYCYINKNIITAIINNNYIDNKLLKLCDFDNYDELYQIIFNDNGVDLGKVKYNFIKLFKLGYNLIKGIILFNKLHFIHLDIKHNNILYVNKKNKLIFIDLGLSLLYKDFLKTSNLKIFTEGFTFNHPPEFIAYKYAYNKIFNNYEYDFINFKKDYENNLQPYILNFIIKYCYNNNEKLYKNALTYLFNEYYNSNNIRKLIKNTLNKIDIYGFGISFVYVIYRNDNLIINDNNDTVNIYNIISKCLFIEPSKRYSAYDIHKLYYKYKLV